METIRTSGMRFVDGKNRERIFSGVNFVDKNCQPGPDGTIHFKTDITAPLLQKLREKGMDVIRLGVTWAGIEPEMGVYNTVYLDEVLQTLRLCGEYGFYVMLDWHQDLFSYYCYTAGDGAPQWACRHGKKPRRHRLIWAEGYFFGTNVMKSCDDFWYNRPVAGQGLRDRFCDMLRFTVRYLKEADCILGYDVCNEPYPGTEGGRIFRTLVKSGVGTLLFSPRVDRRALLRDLGRGDVMGALGVLDDEKVYHRIIGPAAKRLNRFDSGVYASFLRAAAAAIRSETGRGVIFMENSYYSNLGIPCLAPGAVYETGDREPQMAFAPHGYDITVDTPLTNTASTARVEMIFGEHRAKQLRDGMPVLVGEWGGMVPGSDRYPALEFLIGLFDRNRWSQTYWHYHEGFENNGIMQVLCRPRPLAVAGEITAYGYDRERRTFYLRYRGDPAIKAPTLIYLPEKPEKVFSTKKTILRQQGGAYVLQVYAGKGSCVVSVEFA